MEERLMAFWKYDQPPYVLSGEVLSIKESGAVAVKGYDGYFFQTIKILPYGKGLEIRAKIEELGRDTRLKVSQAQSDCKNAVNDLLEG